MGHSLYLPYSIKSLSRGSSIWTGHAVRHSLHPFIADWRKIGDYRQRQTDLNNMRENEKRIDYDYKVGDKILVRKDGILRKTESRWIKD